MLYGANPVLHLHQIFDLVMRGKLDRIFFSGAQIDKYGNLNNTLIGSPNNIRIKLPVQTSWNYIRNTSLCRALTGEKINLLPAVRPDWAIIHAHLSDPKGNVKLHPPYFADLLAIEAPRNSIISVEKIVSEEEMNKIGATVPYYEVTAVVELPFGAHPTSCYPDYTYDKKHLAEYVKLINQSEEIFNLNPERIVRDQKFRVILR